MVCRSILLYLLLAVPFLARAEDEPKLKLALHDVAHVARRVGLKQLLVVVRVDAASVEVPDSALDGIERLALDGLRDESNLQATASDKAREVARKTKARRGLTPAETTAYRNSTPSDAVLCLDYRQGKAQSSVRLSLVDSQKVHFSETVTLAGQVASETPKPAKANAVASPPQGRREQNGPQGTNADQLLTQTPPAGSGFAISRPGNPGFVRTPTQEAADKKAAEQKAAAAQQAGNSDAAGKKGTDSSTNGSRGSASASASAEASATSSSSSDSATGRSPQPATDLAQKIVDFAVSNLGKQVGNGECWTLAAEALKAAGAEQAKGYTFGEPIDLRDVRPGDILQFTSARFDEPGYYAIMGTPNHTAVAYSATGDRMFLLHQNFNGKKTVSTFDVNFNNLTSGQVQAFRAQQRRPD